MCNVGSGAFGLAPGQDEFVVVILVAIFVNLYPCHCLRASRGILVLIFVDNDPADGGQAVTKMGRLACTSTEEKTVATSIMKTMVLTGIRGMELSEVPDPDIEKDTDVLLRLAAVGVCGSDVHYYRTGRIGIQVVEYPFTVGHECAAVVEKAGSAVTRVKPGDRVAVDPAMPCHACDQCKAGRPHTCRNLPFLGCPGQAEGCLSEFIVMPEECCFPVADKMTMEQAALVEPLSIGLYAVRQAGPAKSVGILGSGPIGLSALIAAQYEGVQHIYVTDKIDDRLEVARKAGACWTGNPDTTDIVKGISEKEPLLLDAVLECCGEQHALDQGIELLKPGGTLMMVGIPTVDRVSFTPDLMRRKELRLQNVRRQNGCVQAALDLIESGKVDVDFMITHRFAFEQTKEAFDLVADYRDGVVKAMVAFGGMGSMSGNRA